MARRDGGTLLAQVRARHRPATAAGRRHSVDRRGHHRAPRSRTALHEARSAAEAASRAKSAFLANTSHELRTPLNGIVGLAALARNPALEGGQRQRYLEQIVDSARSLTALISDILDLSKIEAGRMELERAVRPRRAAAHAAADLRAAGCGARPGLALRGRRQRRRRRRRRPAAAAPGDRQLSNALKFTAQGGIVVRAQRLAGRGGG
ncbi:MAG: histidine kinase dimerization/phospho-acceptor domain-containing protein [Rubrivivax sp.]